MLEEALGALALTGGTTVVAAMATDAWQTARDKVIQLFNRDQARQAAIAVQLDGDNALVMQSDDPDRARQGLAAAWQLQMEALLARHHDAESELRAMVEQVRAELPQSQQSWVQHITANGGIAAGAQGPGSGVHIHNQSDVGRAPVSRPSAAEGSDAP